MLVSYMTPHLFQFWSLAFSAFATFVVNIYLFFVIHVLNVLLFCHAGPIVNFLSSECEC